MDEAVIILQNKLEIIQKENMELRKKLENCVESKRKRKGYFETTKENQRLNRIEHKKKFLIINRYLNSFGLKIDSVIIKKFDLEDNINMRIDYSDENKNKTNCNTQECVNAKDLFNLSDQTYCQLKKRLRLKISSIYAIRNEIKTLNKMFNVSYGIKYASNDIVQKMNFILDSLVKNISISNKIRLKLCADSTNIGRKLKVLNFNFSVLNETDRCKTASGHYVIGMFQIEKESHEELKNCLSTFFEKLDNLNNVGNIPVEKFLGGDWKFLSSFVGINSANSNYPCIWCCCHKDKFYDSSVRWSIRMTELGARSHEDATEKMKSKNIDVKKGYYYQSITRTINFDHVILDMLHLFLRITDTLISLLFDDLKILEFKISGYSKSKMEINEAKCLSKFNNFLKYSCGVSNPIYVKNNDFYLKDLRGPEKLKIFEKIDISVLFPEYEKSQNVQSIWKTF